MKAIYKITNKITNEFYIGATTNVKQRFYDYSSKSKIEKEKLYIYKKIKEYGYENFKFEIYKKLEENITFEKMLKIENNIISKLKPSYNKRPFFNFTEETKEKISKSLKKHWKSLPKEKKEKIIKNNLVGTGADREMTKVLKNKISESLKGRKLSEKHKENISKSLKGKKRPNEHIKKRVIQIDKKTGIAIKKYDMVKTASKAVGIHPSNISKCLKNQQKTAGGYIWKYDV